MTIMVPWLADAARLTGYPVVEVAGWRTRGHGGFRAVEGVVLHHTADGPGEYPSLRVVRDGRADLAGPLCNYGLGRSGTIYVVAAGVAWHAGASRWAGFTDLNDEFLGIEAESKGTLDDWTPAQHDAYPRLVAAALYYMRRDASRAAGHKEVCLPAGRKIDPAFWDLTGHRATVAGMLADPVRRIPRGGATASPPAPRTAEEGSMYILCQPPGKPKGVAILSGSIFIGLGTQGEYDSAQQAMDRGALFQWVEQATWDALDERSKVATYYPRNIVDVTPAPAPPKTGV